MGFSLPHTRAFGTAILCTFALFAIAAWLPNDAIDLVAWLIAVFLGLPVSILSRIHANRSAATTARQKPTALTFALRLLGGLSLLLGVGVLGWQAWNGVVRRLPEYTGLTAIAQAVLLVALIGLGYRLLRWPRHIEHTDRNASGHPRED